MTAGNPKNDGQAVGDVESGPRAAQSETCELPLTRLREAADAQGSASAMRPPRGELFAHPTARALWAALMTLPESLIHVFALVLRDYLALPELRKSPHDRRVAQAIGALREAADALAAEGKSPLVSVEVYKGLRAERPEAGWPAEATVRRVLGGSWNEALRQARLEAVPEGDALITYEGGKFSPEELFDAVDACAKDMQAHGIDPEQSLSRHAYIAWANRTDVRARPGRRPVSEGVFQRRGGFEAIREVVLRGGTPADIAALPLAAGLQRGYRYSPAERIEALQEVAAALGRAPRATEYRRVRDRILREERERGEPKRPFPGYVVIIRHYGSWDRALEDAGFEPFADSDTDPVTGRGRRVGATNIVTEEDMLEGLREAYAAKGEPFDTVVYKEYRAECAGVSASGRRIAAYITLWKHFGSFDAAVRAAGIEEA